MLSSLATQVGVLGVLPDRPVDLLDELLVRLGFIRRVPFGLALGLKMRLWRRLLTREVSVK